MDNTRVGRRSEARRRHGTITGATACLVAFASACAPPPPPPPTQAELDEERRIEEFDATAVAALSTVAAAVRYIEATGIGLTGADAVSLESLGLTVDAPEELAEAVGSDVAPILYVRGETTTPWEMSLSTPANQLSLWVGAVRSERHCVAIVMDPDFGDWSGFGEKEKCSATRAARSYGAARGVIGEREEFTWAVLAAGPADAEPPPGPGGALDAAAWAVLDSTVRAARHAAANAGLAAATVEALNALSLTVEASQEVASALGTDEAPIVYEDARSTTPWRASIAAPTDRDHDNVQGLWAVAVYSPLACRAIVLDPELGEWAGVGTDTDCAASNARRSYGESRGIGGHRNGFSWLPLPAAALNATTTTTGPTSGEPAQQPPRAH